VGGILNTTGFWKADRAGKHAKIVSSSLGVTAALGVSFVLAACAAAPSQDETTAGTVHVCSSCHGSEGRSISPTFPRLAGQQKAYLAVQLKAFRDHTRADPHAHTYMWGMAARLTDQTIDGLASYYSSQAPVPGTPQNTTDVATGVTIYQQGNAKTGVPACSGCHGDHAQGMSTFPRLAGQHRAYLELQLAAFASNARANEIMHANAINLTPSEIHQLAAYLASE
jgi:cytochrome c553